jgi:hypothetical protein
MALAIWIHTYPHTPDHRLVVKIVLSNFGVFGGSASRATTRPALLTPDISVHFVQCFDVLDPLEAGIKLKNPVVPSVSFALA